MKDKSAQYTSEYCWEDLAQLKLSCSHYLRHLATGCAPLSASISPSTTNDCPILLISLKTITVAVWTVSRALSTLIRQTPVSTPAQHKISSQAQTAPNNWLASNCKVSDKQMRHTLLLQTNLRQENTKINGEVITRLNN